MTEKGVFDTDLHVEPDDVFVEREIVGGRHASPVSVVEQFKANTGIGDVADADLRAGRIDVALIEAIQRFSIDNAVESLELPGLFAGGKWDLNSET
jgi:hypothetical protein